MATSPARTGTDFVGLRARHSAGPSAGRGIAATRTRSCGRGCKSSRVPQRGRHGKRFLCAERPGSRETRRCAVDVRRTRPAAAVVAGIAGLVPRPPARGAQPSRPERAPAEGFHRAKHLRKQQSTAQSYCCGGFDRFSLSRALSVRSRSRVSLCVCAVATVRFASYTPHVTPSATASQFGGRLVC